VNLSYENIALLMLAVGCLLFPAVLDATRNDNAQLDLTKIRTMNATVASLDELNVVCNLCLLRR
jgi:hypothetical protein